MRNYEELKLEVIVFNSDIQTVVGEDDDFS